MAVSVLSGKPSSVCQLCTRWSWAETAWRQSAAIADKPMHLKRPVFIWESLLPDAAGRDKLWNVRKQEHADARSLSVRRRSGHLPSAMSGHLDLAGVSAGVPSSPELN